MSMSEVTADTEPAPADEVAEQGKAGQAGWWNAALQDAGFLRCDEMLTDEQRQKYEALQQMAREELETIDKELAAEIARAKKRLEELQEQKRAVKQIFDGASVRLGHASVVELKEVNAGDLISEA